MESGLADFIKTTNARRIAVRASIQFAVVSVLFILAISIFLFLAKIDLATLYGKIILMTALLWVTVLLVSGRNWFTSSTLLAREVNMALVPILSNTFNRTLLYTYNENTTDTIAQMLEESSLITGVVTNLNVKNVYTVFSDTDMRVHEIAFEQKSYQPNTKTVKYYATFIDVNLSQDHKGETLVSTPASRFGFSHEEFVSYVSEQGDYTEIPLSQEQTNLLSVFGSKASEMIFSNEMLQSLILWSKESKVNIRVMRKGTKLYILVPASKESTTYTSTFSYTHLTMPTTPYV